jgi:hypothetical protein
MFKVYSTHLDGTHELGEFATYAEAKTFSDDWLGKHAHWENQNTAIDLFGGVLKIREELDW